MKRLLPAVLFALALACAVLGEAPLEGRAQLVEPHVLGADVAHVGQADTAEVLGEGTQKGIESGIHTRTTNEARRFAAAVYAAPLAGGCAPGYQLELLEDDGQAAAVCRLAGGWASSRVVLAAAPAPMPAPDVTDEQAAAAFELLFRAVTEGKGWLVVGPLVTLLVWLLRWLASKWLPRLGNVLRNDLVAFSLPWLVSMAGAFTNALLAAPYPPGPDVLQAAALGALKVAVTAILAFLTVNQTRKAIEASRAAGAKAAAGVATKSDAVRLFEKGPSP